MNKRGIGNIEMIMSFLLFMGFVFGALFFFTPNEGNANVVDSSLDYALDSLLKNSTIDMYSYSIKLNITSLSLSGNPNIISIFFPLEIFTVKPNFNVSVESYNGKKLEAKRDATNPQIVYVKWSNEPFIIIRFSEDFIEYSNINFASPPEINRSFYYISSSNTRKVLSEKKLLELNNSYNNNYQKTKEELDLPAQVEFGFRLQYDNGNIIESKKNVPIGSNVYSTLTHRETTLKQGNTLTYGDLSVQIW